MCGRWEDLVGKGKVLPRKLPLMYITEVGPHTFQFHPVLRWVIKREGE